MLRFDFPKTFNDLLEDTIPTDYVSPGVSVPSMDITEHENEYTAIVELPGVKKEDVKITFEKDVLWKVSVSRMRYRRMRGYCSMRCVCASSAVRFGFPLRSTRRTSALSSKMEY